MEWPLLTNMPASFCSAARHLPHQRPATTWVLCQVLRTLLLPIGNSSRTGYTKLLHRCCNGRLKTYTSTSSTMAATTSAKSKRTWWRGKHAVSAYIAKAPRTPCPQDRHSFRKATVPWDNQCLCQRHGTLLIRAHWHAARWEETLASSYHGAGRTLNRTQTKKSARGRPIVREREDRGIFVCSAGRATLIDGHRVRRIF